MVCTQVVFGLFWFSDFFEEDKIIYMLYIYI
jgi:hypothetical protein